MRATLVDVLFERFGGMPLHLQKKHIPAHPGSNLALFCQVVMPHDLLVGAGSLLSTSALAREGLLSVQARVEKQRP